MNYIKKFESFSQESNVKIGDTVDIDMSKVQGISTHPGHMAYDVLVTNIINEWPNMNMVEFELDGQTYKAPMSAVKSQNPEKEQTYIEDHSRNIGHESETDYDLIRQAEELQMSSPQYRGVSINDIVDELKKRRA